ncbi:hypothetical protein JKF63_06987 [Porcisia hertigi]|uniref:Uncharacterized protein n=1 Tax=Porcisia hertigi TaxID=2761500 RepID=A0A836IP90_9TRYP|nr:hypothetical protein JKF63_06987 [Porcisia hertigi]
MAYEHKHNKRSRCIAAAKRKKAAAAAALAASLAPVCKGDDDGGSAAVVVSKAAPLSTPSAGGMAPSCTSVTITSKDGTIVSDSLTAANVKAADTNMTHQARQSKSQQQTSISDDRCCWNMPNLLCSALPTSDDLARLSVTHSTSELPALLAATHLRCTHGVSTCSPRLGAEKSSEGHYFAYLLSEPLNGDTKMPMTMWGVYSLSGGDCLQVVHWHNSPAAAASPITEGDQHSPSIPLSAQTTREIIMHVSAAGLCFMLAPPSLISVEGSSAAGSMTPARVSSEPPDAAVAAAESPDVYWLIPSIMKDSFFALLQAQEWLRTAPLHHPASQARVRSLECHGWSLQPHPTRWVSPSAPLKTTDSVTETCERPKSLPEPKRKAIKTNVRRGRPSPREGLQSVQSVTGARLATDGAELSSTPQFRIPYVAAVGQLQKGFSGAPEPHLPLVAVPVTAITTATLLVGNCIAPYPADGTRCTGVYRE